MNDASLFSIGRNKLGPYRLYARNCALHFYSTTSLRGIFVYQGATDVYPYIKCVRMYILSLIAHTVKYHTESTCASTYSSYRRCS